MSNPTTPFNWQMPTNTDLVTDLPADFEVFGQAVATSMADLLGGTTGQILSKNSNTDMDFVWIANDQGDITGITATSPLTGGGTSGAITVGIQASSTTQSGAVQLTDSTSSTSTTTAATPNSVKTAFDTATTANTTANAAIPKSTVTTAGDVIYATGSSAVTRLGIGTAGQVLTVNGGGTAPSWATPAAASGGLTLVKTQTIGTAVSSVTVTSAFSSTYDSYLIVVNGGVASTLANLGLQLGSTTTGYYAAGVVYNYSNAGATAASNNNAASWTRAGSANSSSIAFYNAIQDPFLSKNTKVQTSFNTTQSDSQAGFFYGFLDNSTSYTAFTITPATGTLTGGTIRVYGYQNS
jgi:hypothetical protein